MFCTVITQIKGARNYTQNGSGIILNSGDTTLIDSAFPMANNSREELVSERHGVVPE